MNSPQPSNHLDIFEIYRRFCEIISQNAYVSIKGSYRKDDESPKAKFSREALAELFNLVESTVNRRILVFDQLFKLMSRLNLADFSEFSRFYDFVFFMCRENGQKNITVSRAVTAWRLVLAGRFRLLNQWCDFVERNQRHNISEDTWQQVLLFSRCIHENLEGFDPKGAWPVLIDDFVVHMYSRGNSQSQSRGYEDPLPGLKTYPGLKRKSSDIEKDEMESSDTHFPDFADHNHMLTSKRNRLVDQRPVSWEDNPPGSSGDDCMEIVRHNSPLGSAKSSSAVKGCFSKGFAGQFQTRSFLQVDRGRRLSYI